MNKQRKVLITITYNEMGIIIDTKAEEVTQPNLQPTCNQFAKDICVPCKDTISRQDAIDALDNIKIPRNASWYPYYQQALTAMSRLPSAQPEPRWIPVTERLPEPMGWDKSYLVSLAWDGVGVMEYKSTGFHNYGSFSPVPIETVTAWRELPEPYKERREE